MLLRVVWWLDTNVSEDRAPSIFTPVKTSNLAKKNTSRWGTAVLRNVYVKLILILVFHLCLTDPCDNAGIVRLEKMLSARNAQVAVASFDMIESILDSYTRPLCVLTSDSKSIK
jgi:hypothetical protein